ncbi:hypothetical protein ALC60_00687 [Trachymyrmex zeteki]|uniref:Uncharacterized protein n=1 Tax=Mycetomoellerius zeteki TaxID=64791 RepID=A0A151XIP9_9HYME|nr:hypothetical protein ALC60_00687 [Trachymyrmex zeteki]
MCTRLFPGLVKLILDTKCHRDPTSRISIDSENRAISFKAHVHSLRKCKSMIVASSPFAIDTATGET